MKVGKQSQMWQNTLILMNLRYIEKLMGQVNLAGMRYRISVSFLSWILHLKFFLQNNLRKRKKKADKMNIPRYVTHQEREAYRIGYERGRQEGLKKASLLIQLLASDSSEFKENILQNSKEAVEMVRILTGKGE